MINIHGEIKNDSGLLTLNMNCVYINSASNRSTIIISHYCDDYFEVILPIEVEEII